MRKRSLMRNTHEITVVECNSVDIRESDGRVEGRVVRIGRQGSNVEVSNSYIFYSIKGK